MKISVSLFFFVALFLSYSFSDEKLREFRIEFQKIERLIKPPEDFLALKDTSYFLDQLVKIDFGANYKINSISVNDAPSDWFRTEIKNVWESKRIDIARLNFIAQKNKLKNCSLVYPVVVFVGSYQERNNSNIQYKGRDTPLPIGYYSFGGKRLSGRILFGETIYFHFSHTGTQH